MITTLTVNTPSKLYFQTTTGITDFTNIAVINEGIQVLSPSINITETSVLGVYLIVYTPISTGRGIILFNDIIISHIEVVAKGVYEYLKNIEDESLGSWSWDKQLGKLTMFKQDGSSLAEFDIVENLTLASRERV